MAGILIISRIRGSGKEGKEESKCARKRLARALHFVFFFFYIKNIFLIIRIWRLKLAKF